MTKKNTCIECGTSISRNATRCRSCASKKKLKKGAEKMKPKGQNWERLNEKQKEKAQKTINRMKNNRKGDNKILRDDIHRKVKFLQEERRKGYMALDRYNKKVKILEMSIKEEKEKYKDMDAKIDKLESAISVLEELLESKE